MVLRAARGKAGRERVASLWRDFFSAARTGVGARVLRRRRAREERHVRAPRDAGKCGGTKGDDDGGDALLRGTSDARLELERWQILAHLLLQRNAAARLLDRRDHERRRIGRRHRRLLGRAVALLAVLGLLWRRGGAQAAQINSAARHRACAEQRCARRKQ